MIGNKLLINTSSYVNVGAVKSDVQKFPEFGVMTGYMPNMSKNNVDIESRLFGINSTNLVTPEKPLVVQPNIMSTVSFFEHNNSHPVLPEPLIIEGNQRPLLI